MTPENTTDDSFRVLFEHSPDAIFIENRAGVILDANPAAARLHGIDRADLVGRTVFDLVPEPERERVRRDFEGWFSGSLARYDGFARHASGASVAVEITGTPLLFRGEPAVVLHVRDVSARAAAEQALIEREWQVAYALDQGDAVLFRRSFVADCYDYLAPGIERLTGYPAAEMTPSRWDALVVECDFAGELAGLPQGEPRARFLAGLVNRWQSQVRIRRRQGDERWVLDMSTIVRDAEGRPVGALGVLQDITDLRRMEERIGSAQRIESLGIMAGGIAHDFNNLLVGILGNADLALQELPPGATAAEFVEDVKKAALRASELTNLMLAFAGRSRFSIVPVDLNELVEETVHLVRAGASKRIDFLRALDPALPRVEADAAQLRRVLLNLLVNATEAIGDAAGRVSIATGVGAPDAAARARMAVAPTAPTDRFVWLSVRDSGAGMDPQTLAHIFEPFFSTKFTGRGLGLASALGIVRSHHGGILVESAPGAGSSFTIHLPLPATPLPPASVPRPVPALRGEGTVLVVDDEEAVRGVARRMLERAGFSVATAGGGDEAAVFCRDHRGPLAAILLDLTMPGRGGAEILPVLRGAFPATPVVLMSGYAEEDALRRFRALGVQSFLQKPFTQATLAARLRAVLPRADADAGSPP